MMMPEAGKDILQLAGSCTKGRKIDRLCGRRRLMIVDSDKAFSAVVEASVSLARR